MSKEVAKFIANCASNGITQPDDIADAARKLISEIDEKLKVADLLRRERADLIAVIKTFGLETEIKKKNLPKISEMSPESDLDSTSLNHIYNICEYLETKKMTNPRELMTVFGITSDRDFEIYTVTKWLCSHGICSREYNGNIIIGPAWKDRPRRS